MGAELFDSRPDLLGESADRILGWSLREACLRGSAGELTRTERAQPALYALAYALWEEFSERVSRPPAGAAGHSLGEYAALAAAGAFSFADGLRLVAARGAAMARAAGAEPSGMAALLGCDREQAEAAAAARREEGGRLWVANLNAPGQVVMAGGADDIAWLREQADRFGARRVAELPVAGAFHSPFMESAAPETAEALAAVRIGEPAFPVWSNVTGRPAARGEIAGLLERQVTAPVLFADSLRDMAQAGIEVFIHIGPGDVTAGFAKRTVAGATALTVNSSEATREAAHVAGWGGGGGETAASPGGSIQ